jgi:hypothetical protein
MREMHDAGDQVFHELKNLVVWNKTSPAQGSFYRSQFELIFVFKVSPGQPSAKTGVCPGQYPQYRCCLPASGCLRHFRHRTMAA